MPIAPTLPVISTPFASTFTTTINLPRVIKATGTKRRQIVFPPVQASPVLANDLAGLYIKVVRAWRDQASAMILPLYTATLRQLTAADHLVRMLRREPREVVDSPSDLQAQLDASESTVSRLVLTLTPALRDWTVRAETSHRSRFVAAAKTAAGVSLDTMLTAGGVQTTLEAAYAENLALIRNIDDDMRKSIGGIIFRGFQSRTPRREVAKEINDALQIGRKRALRIASDQTTKLSAMLDRERQEEIGIDHFKWMHSGKVHYRPAHKARDGKVFPWQNNGLNGDLPGVAINCGCKARAFIDLEAE